METTPTTTEELKKQLAAIEQIEIEAAVKEYNEFVTEWSKKHRVFIDNEMGLRNSDGSPLRLTIRRAG